MKRSTRLFSLGLSLLFLVAACGDDPAVNGGPDTGVIGPDAGAGNDQGSDETPDADAPDGGDDAGPQAPALPALSELEPGWNEIAPGGDTICSRGTDYAFFVYPGDPKKIAVNFFGGGACWNEATCSVAGSTFADSIEQIRQGVAAGLSPGIFDMEHEDNPIAGWTHVVLPYCTGDIHWGNASVVYGTFEIHHRGAVNSRAVLDWIYDNIEEPEKVFATGCSAGSYGSALWSAHLAEHYPSAKIYQFGDSGAGVITEDFFMQSFPSWNATEVFPSWIPSLDPQTQDILEKSLPDLYIGIAEAYPDSIFSQYNTRFDDNQVFFYEAMGGDGGKEAWSQKMLESIDTIKAGAPNFRAFTATGDMHCILPFNEFFTRRQNDVLLIDWLADMLADEPVDDVECAECTP